VTLARPTFNATTLGLSSGGYIVAGVNTGKKPVLLAGTWTTAGATVPLAIPGSPYAVAGTATTPLVAVQEQDTSNTPSAVAVATLSQGMWRSTELPASLITTLSSAVTVGQTTTLCGAGPAGSLCVRSSPAKPTWHKAGYPTGSAITRVLHAASADWLISDTVTVAPPGQFTT